MFSVNTPDSNRRQFDFSDLGTRRCRSPVLDLDEAAVGCGRRMVEERRSASLSTSSGPMF
jgi:hypothetical protein